MYDSFNRKINYLRISVTDRCNLRCVYCMPEEGIELMKHDDILSFEEIVDIVKEGVAKGITKVRLTGGEPLVRKGIVDLVRQISEIKGIKGPFHDNQWNFARQICFQTERCWPP
ncbi:MAG: radical SAM protein [Bacteroidales bacterium]|nr:radical SAM protein [Bacteroidales bacterium]